MSDLISRQAILKHIEKIRQGMQMQMMDDTHRANIVMTGMHLCEEAARNQPSAQPERKKGWWLIREGISDAQCSECKMYFRDIYDMDNVDAFCRHCGAKMEGLKVVKHG